MNMRNTVFPVYVVIDFSESMQYDLDNSSEKRISVAKEIIPVLYKSMWEDASVAESLRVRVIGFNEGIAFSTELLDYPGLKGWYEKESDSFVSRCKYRTWYGAAFDRVRTCINKDIDTFEKEGKTFFRPLVYFLTDGKPEGENDNDREKKYNALVNNPDERRNPVVLCVGIGPEDMSILRQYGASRFKSKDGEYKIHNKEMTFIIRKGAKSGDGLKRLNESVIETIKYSLQKRVRTESSKEKSINEIDPGAFEDDDVGSKLAAYFAID